MTSALVPAASYGIAVAAKNLPFSAGQTILTLDQEFPSNVYAWRELTIRKSGRVIHAKREHGENWTEAVLRSIDERTAIVALPQCHSMDGSTIDLERVGERARSAGAGLVIDASQSLGASLMDLERIKPDFVTAEGYKWLLGPYSLGYLYVAPRWRNRESPWKDHGSRAQGAKTSGASSSTPTSIARAPAASTWGSSLSSCWHRWRLPPWNGFSPGVSRESKEPFPC